MRRLLLLPFIIGGIAGLELPEQGPIPVQNPRPSSAAPLDAPIVAPKPPSGKSSPEPTQGTSPAPAVKTAVPEDKPVSKQSDLPGIVAPVADTASLASCEAELRTLGVSFRRVEPVSGENGCGISAPYEIKEIARGVALTPASPLRCKTALAMAQWVDTVVIPSTKALPGEVRLAAVNHGSTYVCRRRNNSVTGKMSEHAIGNAVDVMSFEFTGRDPIAISPRAGAGTVEEAFQRAVRGGACLHFTTVLGPGTNASHNDHLHLDIIQRKRGYRLCE